MAIFRSILLGDISGSIDGITFSKNSSVRYIKAKIIPVNPNSERQQQVRSNWASMAADWLEILTQAQRDVWDTYADNVPLVNRLGVSRKVKGFQMFMRSSSISLLAGGSIIADGPSIFNLGETDPTMAAVIDEANQEMSVSFDDTLQWVDEDGAFMQIRMSLPQNASRNFLIATYKRAGDIAGDATTAPTTPQTFDTPFPVAESQKVLVEGRILLADGRLSNGFRSTSIITA